MPVVARPPAAAQRTEAVPAAMSSQHQGAARASMLGRWTLSRYVQLRGDSLERPVRPRTAMERPAEQWTFHPDGRFEHAIDDLASAGRWRVAGTLAADAHLQVLVPNGWTVLALEEVLLSAIPDRPPRAEWLLVGIDADSRVLVWLGARLDPEAADLGGRFVAAR